MLRRFFAGMLLLGAATAPVHAEMLTFNFTGRVDYTFEYEKATERFTNPLSSNLSGQTFLSTDTFHGQLSYDSATPLSPYYQPPAQEQGSYVLYYSAQSSNPLLTVTFDQTGVVLAWPNRPFLVQLSDSATAFGGYDRIYFQPDIPYSTEYFQTFELSLADSAGTAFSDSLLPTDFNLTDFTASNLHYAWLDQATGNQFHVNGVLTSLTRVGATELPEPASSALILLGVGMLAAATTKRAARLSPDMNDRASGCDLS